MDAVWLVEHHFSGICPYADPIGLASAIAAITKRVKIGFSVLQASFHHPVKLAEQIALLDNISRGRMIIGMGRGNRGALYEYDAYKVDENETQDRLEETEELLIKLLSGGPVTHEGAHFQVRIPEIRPHAFSKPHPLFLRSVSRDPSFIAMAKQGRPMLTGFGSEDETVRKIKLYKETMRETGYDEEKIADNLANSWSWRRVFVAETNEEAERVGLTAFRAMRGARQNDSARLHALVGRTAPNGGAGEEALIWGTPERVAETIAQSGDKTGLGGMILAFRLGEMPAEVAENSLRLFMKEVAPQFQSSHNALATV
jgi:alkanesulfonate monooxygenase SsuD/methylene tetrahydromethanopterin reductase-like flavin-dependent oxidoreductase (luciferase family)